MSKGERWGCDLDLENQSQQPKQSICEGDSDLFKGPTLNVTFSVLQKQSLVGIRVFLEKFQIAGAEEVTALQNPKCFIETWRMCQNCAHS